MLCYGELHSHNYKERQLLDMNRLFLTIQPPHSYAILIATTSESWIEYTSWPQFANQRVSHKLWRLPSCFSPHYICIRAPPIIWVDQATGTLLFNPALYEPLLDILHDGHFLHLTLILVRHTREIEVPMTATSRSVMMRLAIR